MRPMRWRRVFTYKHEDPQDPSRITRRKTRVVVLGFDDDRLDDGLKVDSPTVSLSNLRLL